mmetsp:Transcript_1050/g.2378  ORF Transcript_1050/g.2378 Transcript_1050/m.2378 type:complete len:98 (+) Transcript_1050:424-717(+)
MCRKRAWRSRRLPSHFLPSTSQPMDTDYGWTEVSCSGMIEPKMDPDTGPHRYASCVMRCVRKWALALLATVALRQLSHGPSTGALLVPPLAGCCFWM